MVQLQEVPRRCLERGSFSWRRDCPHRDRLELAVLSTAREDLILDDAQSLCLRPKRAARRGDILDTVRLALTPKCPLQIGESWRARAAKKNNDRHHCVLNLRRSVLYVSVWVAS
jgi:hypothetical protein